MGSKTRAAQVHATAGNVVALSDWRPAPARGPRRPARAPLIAGMVVSVLAHAALLQWLEAPSMAAATEPRTMEVVLVQPPVPWSAPPPPAHRVAEATARSARPAVGNAAGPVERPRARAPAEPAAPALQHDSAPVSAPSLAVPRDEPADVAQAPFTPAEPAAAPPSPRRAEPPAAASSAALQPGPVSPPTFHAGYLRNPPPRYPLIARRNGEQGTVTLRVLVTREGLPGSVVLEKTSGSAALDAAALATVKEWRFVPAQQNGQAVDAPVLVPIVFRLQDAS